jgi:hypothetical protein
MNLRTHVDRMLEDLNPTERTILARRFAALRATWRGRLEAMATARSSGALEAPIAARDRHRIRRYFRPIVLELERLARRFRKHGFDYQRSAVELVARRKLERAALGPLGSR